MTQKGAVLIIRFEWQMFHVISVTGYETEHHFFAEVYYESRGKNIIRQP
jgi:hypothetical protein